VACNALFSCNSAGPSERSRSVDRGHQRLPPLGGVWGLSRHACAISYVCGSVVACAEKETMTQLLLLPPCVKVIPVSTTSTKVVDVVC
jgi:hypothetical protein